MVKLVMKLVAYVAIILFMLVSNVASRRLSYVATELVSDGVSNANVAREEESFLRLKEDSSEEQCELMYGFLPCSSNIPSHVFLIVIYEYLLYHGESYAGGDGRIFRFLGKNFFVLSFSQLLDSLPDALILLAIGQNFMSIFVNQHVFGCTKYSAGCIFGSPICSFDMWVALLKKVITIDYNHLDYQVVKKKAQEYVVTGAGLLAGSSILLLTLLWGICFICSRKDFYVAPGSKVQDKGIPLLTGSGVLTDQETCYHAKVMFYSLIPFVVILLPSVFGVSYTSQEYEIVLLVSLSVSLICLLCYFFYQLFDSRIQERRKEYAEVEQKVEMHVPFYDVQALMLDREKHLMIKQKQLEKTLKDPATCKETKTNEEFYHQFEEWIDGTKQLMDDPYSLDRTGTEYNEVVELLLEDRNKLVDLISDMMERASGEKLLRKDGTQDPSVIDSFFRCIDNDTDGSVTTTELKNFIMREEMLVDVEVADIILRHLDVDGNGVIDKEEFKSGITKLLTSRNLHRMSLARTGQDDRYHQAEAKAKAAEKFKAIILLIIGILMLTFLAEPLVESVRKFSDSVKIEPFYVSFILVPLATNARTAIAAIQAAKQKRHHTTSLTFSEIYHKVFMNNILGFFVLTSVIYFRGLTWHFSAEVLVVIIVCVIMGLLASYKSKLPNWTLLIAFPLYPLSLVVVYFVNDAFQFT